MCKQGENEKGEPQMAINLSNLNISLDAFNKEACGVMNIGQIKLSSDGKRRRRRR